MRRRSLPRTSNGQRWCANATYRKISGGATAVQAARGTGAQEPVRCAQLSRLWPRCDRLSDSTTGVAVYADNCEPTATVVAEVPSCRQNMAAIGAENECVREVDSVWT